MTVMVVLITPRQQMLAQGLRLRERTDLVAMVPLLKPRIEIEICLLPKRPNPLRKTAMQMQIVQSAIMLLVSKQRQIRYWHWPTLLKQFWSIPFFNILKTKMDKFIIEPVQSLVLCSLCRNHHEHSELIWKYKQKVAWNEMQNGAV